MAISPINANMNYSSSPNFKGAPKLNVANVQRIATKMVEPKSEGLFKKIQNSFNKKYDELVEKTIVKPILQPLMNSEFMGKMAEKTKNIDNMAAHMSTAGSIVTTTTYATTSLKTLRKDKEQKKRAKTLVLNQIMVTTLSTVLGYAINDSLGNFSKQLGYKFREVNQGHPALERRMKGFNTAKSLLIFSMMYRYVAPVLVTPLASKVGNYMNNKNEQKANATEQQKPVEVAKK
ncbi:hypothetical protein IKJ53_00045 [bacterium]|nr:hypothetical protein [bacterium]